MTTVYELQDDRDRLHALLVGVMEVLHPGVSPDMLIQHTTVEELSEAISEREEASQWQGRLAKALDVEMTAPHDVKELTVRVAHMACPKDGYAIMMMRLVPYSRSV